MEKDRRQWLKEKGWEKWFRKENLVVLILYGVLLFIIALPTEKERSLTMGESDVTTTKAENTETGEEMGTEEYVTSMERKLTDILSDMADVGNVKVMITLKASEERIIEKEAPVNRTATNESDSQGGSRSVNEYETGDNTVYRTEGNASEPYVVKTLTPKIEGVLVVAEGAGSGSVNKTVTEIAQALFGVEAHKVKVVKMESKSSAGR